MNHATQNIRFTEPIIISKNSDTPDEIVPAAKNRPPYNVIVYNNVNNQINY
jgi:hypothetical protein